MSPELNHLIINLYEKGLCEEDIHEKLQDMADMQESCTLEDVYEALIKHRMGRSAYDNQRPSKLAAFSKWGSYSMIGLFIIFKAISLIYR